jgi:hypothetical protein
MNPFPIGKRVELISCPSFPGKVTGSSAAKFKCASTKRVVQGIRSPGHGIETYCCNALGCPAMNMLETRENAAMEGLRRRT